MVGRFLIYSYLVALVHAYLHQLDDEAPLVEGGDEVGGLLVDVALADPPAVVLVTGPHLAQPRRRPLPVARLVVADVVAPRLA